MGIGMGTGSGLAEMRGSGIERRRAALNATASEEEEEEGIWERVVVDEARVVK
jgi:hypothetical protein